MNRALPLLLFAVVVAGLAAAWLWMGSDPRSDSAALAAGANEDTAGSTPAPEAAVVEPPAPANDAPAPQPEREETTHRAVPSPQFHLPPPPVEGAIRGVVVDDLGWPYWGAEVRLLTDDEGSPRDGADRPILTSQEGTFTIPLHAPDRVAVLRVFAARYTPATRGGLGPGQTVRITLEPTTVLAGIVRDSQRAIEGARVRWSAPAFGLTGSARTDASGRFELEGVPAFANDDASPDEQLVELRVEADGYVPLVTTPGDDRSSIDERIHRLAARRISPAAPHVRVFELEPLEVPRGGTPDAAGAPTDRPPTAEVRGRVVDAGGRGVHGARVAALAFEDRLSAIALVADKDPAVSSTGPDGRYELAAAYVHDGVVQIEATCFSPCGTPLTRGRIEFAAKAGGSTDAPPIVIATPLSVTLVVADPDGRCVPRAQVQRLEIGRERYVTDVSGSCEIPFDRSGGSGSGSTVRVRVLAPGFLPAETADLRELGTRGQVARFVIVPGRSISGRIRFESADEGADDASSEFPEGVVTAYDASIDPRPLAMEVAPGLSRSPLLPAGTRALATTRVARDGWFELRGLPEGRHHLVFRPEQPAIVSEDSGPDCPVLPDVESDGAPIEWTVSRRASDRDAEPLAPGSGLDSLSNRPGDRR